MKSFTAGSEFLEAVLVFVKMVFATVVKKYVVVEMILDQFAKLSEYILDVKFFEIYGTFFIEEPAMIKSIRSSFLEALSTTTQVRHEFYSPCASRWALGTTLQYQRGRRLRFVSKSCQLCAKSRCGSHLPPC